MFGWSYYGNSDGRWWRLFGLQLGYHPHGRRKSFSERYGYRRPTPTLRVGQRAEVSFMRVRKAPRVQGR